MLNEFFKNIVNFLTAVNIDGKTNINNSLTVSSTLEVQPNNPHTTLYVTNSLVGINTEFPNVSFTVNGEISSNSVIYDEVGNSTMWNSGFTSVSKASASWDSVYTSVKNTSANWDSVYSSVLNTSANWDSVYTSVKDTSANWDSVYSTYNKNSSEYTKYEYVNNNFLPLSGGTVTGITQFNNNVTIWGVLSATGGTYFANTIYSTTSALSVIHVGNGPAVYVGQSGTGDIASFYDLDQNVEVFHIGGANGDHPNVGVKTSTPNVDFTVNGEISSSKIIYDASGNSSQWNSAYSKQTNYLPLSGGTMTGRLVAAADATASKLNIGNAISTSPTTTVDGDVWMSFTNRPAWKSNSTIWTAAVVNNANSFTSNQAINVSTAAPALRINQIGTGNALVVEDSANPDATPFVVDANGSVGIGLSSLGGIDAKLTVVGDISATGVVYASGGNSNIWNSVYSSVNPLSSNWDSVYTSVKDTSANWDSVYSSVLNTSANWDSVYSSVLNTSANWDSVYTSVKYTSANWDSVYSTVKNASATFGGSITNTLTSDLNVGAITAGQVFDIGTTFQAFAEKLITKVFYPTFTLTSNLASIVESGTTGITLTVNLNKGLITGKSLNGIWQPTLFQNNRSGDATKYTILGVDNGTTTAYTSANAVIIDGTNTFLATVDYDTGPQPVDSKNNNFNSPLVAGSISPTLNVTGRRKAFYGINSAGSTSTEIRALSSLLNPQNGSSFNISLPIGTTSIVFAYPASLRDVTEVRESVLNSDIKSAFGTPYNVNVFGNNSYSAISYKVYRFQPPNPIATANYSYTVTI